jgi:hypothetical protein
MKKIIEENVGQWRIGAKAVKIEKKQSKRIISENQ